jgi:DDE superfamily endonuclease
MMRLRERAAFMTVSMMMMLSTSAVFEAGIQRKSRTRSPSRRRPRPKFETIVAYLTAQLFQNEFRLSLPSFGRVLLILRDELAKNEEMARRSSGGVIEPAVRLALTLRILSGASYHDMMLLFRLAKSTVFNVFFETVKSLNKRLRIPGVPCTNAEKLDELSHGFCVLAPRRVTAVRMCWGIAVKIFKPPDNENPASYYCRKGFYVIPVQAVVDSDYKFMYMSAICVGSTHDSVAWAVSKLVLLLVKGAMILGYWIAGDVAYECANGIVTPWPLSKVCDSTYGVERDSFNFFHSSTRMHVEQAFGILLARFGILWKPLCFQVSKVPVILTYCMALHNFCLENQSPPIQMSITALERERTDAAFAAWWRIRSDGIIDYVQGRRRDLETCDIRQALTEELKEVGLMRQTS